MKYKNKVAYLVARQKWYDSQSQTFKSAHKRPGSVKCN